jgi:hypothetical protein
MKFQFKILNPAFGKRFWDYVIDKELRQVNCNRHSMKLLR